MIRHHNKFIQFHMREMGRYIVPTLFDDPPRIIQPHFPIHDFPKLTCPVLGADGHGIRPGL